MSQVLLEMYSRRFPWERDRGKGMRNKPNHNNQAQRILKR